MRIQLKVYTRGTQKVSSLQSFVWKLNKWVPKSSFKVKFEKLTLCYFRSNGDECCFSKHLKIS